MPKLSVVVATFNTEPYLDESLTSVFDQSFKDFELIIVDDCSTDDSHKIISKYTHLPNVICLKNKYNEGVPFSRNKAFLHSKGEYIVIHDADDISLPARFEKQVDFLDKHREITFVGGHATRISITGQEIGSMCYPPKHTGDAHRVIRQFKLNPIIDPSSMFRRQPILGIGAYRMDPELKTVQDFDLWCRLLVAGHQLYNFQEPLIKYRINPNGVTRVKKQEQVEATDIVWSAFKKRNFPTVKLRPECFAQDFESDLMNSNKEN